MITMNAAEPSSRLAELVRETAETEILRRLLLSKPLSRGEGAPIKLSARLTLRRGTRILFFEESYSTGRVRQFALSLGEIFEKLPPLMGGYGQIQLITSLGDASLLRSRGGRETLRGESALRARMSEGCEGLLSELTSLERERERILRGDEPFLRALGISDSNGRVRDKRQGKFRQINRFLEYVADIYGRLPGEGKLLVYDLCCGKSYLSFALYHYLTVLRGREVAMLGMDLKDDVMRDCRTLAAAAGFGERAADGGWIGMRFLAGDIRNLPPERAPHLVVSLHACDIATDIVLSTAARLGAEVILSTPCCHRTLGEHLSAPALDFILREPKLRGKFAEAATDALRCLYLSACGYTAHTTELVDPDDTPKNTLIRAVRDRSPRAAGERRAEYLAALRLLCGDRAEAYLAASQLTLPGGDGE